MGGVAVGGEVTGRVGSITSSVLMLWGKGEGLFSAGAKGILCELLMCFVCVLETGGLLLQRWIGYGMVGKQGSIIDVM